LILSSLLFRCQYLRASLKGEFAKPKLDDRGRAIISMPDTSLAVFQPLLHYFYLGIYYSSLRFLLSLVLSSLLFLSRRLICSGEFDLDVELLLPFIVLISRYCVEELIEEFGNIFSLRALNQKLIGDPGFAAAVFFLLVASCLVLVVAFISCSL
jgi:hypothetical protein